MVGAKAVVKWALPAGAVGAAGLLSGRYLTTGVAILVVCAMLAVSLMFAAIVGKLLDPPMDRWVARWACDWLDGRSVGWQIWRPEADGMFRRLYQVNDSERVEKKRGESARSCMPGSSPKPRARPSQLRTSASYEDNDL
jgi:hypothetical protein